VSIGRNGWGAQVRNCRQVGNLRLAEYFDQGEFVSAQQVPDTMPARFDMDNSKRARTEKSRTQPRERAYVESLNLRSALERIRRAACLPEHACPEQRLRVTTRGRSPER